MALTLNGLCQLFHVVQAGSIQCCIYTAVSDNEFCVYDIPLQVIHLL